MREKQLQNDILRYLAGNPDLRIWRNNVGVAVPVSSCCDRCRVRAIRFGVPGSADLLGILRGGQYLAIEVKSDIGRQSHEQEVYERVISDMGGKYVLARSLNDLTGLV